MKTTKLKTYRKMFETKVEFKVFLNDEVNSCFYTADYAIAFARLLQYRNPRKLVYVKEIVTTEFRHFLKPTIY